MNGAQGDEDLSCDGVHSDVDQLLGEDDGAASADDTGEPVDSCDMGGQSGDDTADPEDDPNAAENDPANADEAFDNPDGSEGDDADGGS